MCFQSKIYSRLGAITGGIVGVFAMIAAVSMEQAKLGAFLIMACAGFGSVLGNLVEKRKG